MEESKIILAFFFMFIGAITLAVVALNYEYYKGKRAQLVKRMTGYFAIEYVKLYNLKPTNINYNHVCYIVIGSYFKGEKYVKLQVDNYLKELGGK